MKASKMFTVGRRKKYYVSLVKKQWLNRFTKGTETLEKLFPDQRGAEEIRSAQR